jgi:hypothetical protein
MAGQAIAFIAVESQRLPGHRRLRKRWAADKK